MKVLKKPNDSDESGKGSAIAMLIEATEQGQKVLRTTARSALGTLPKGIFSR
jgi:hypothetical protein